MPFCWANSVLTRAIFILTILMELYRHFILADVVEPTSIRAGFAHHGRLALTARRPARLAGVGPAGAEEVCVG